MSEKVGNLVFLGKDVTPVEPWVWGQKDLGSFETLPLACRVASFSVLVHLSLVFLIKSMKWDYCNARGR